MTHDAEYLISVKCLMRYLNKHGALKNKRLSYATRAALCDTGDFKSLGPISEHIERGLSGFVYSYMSSELITAKGLKAMFKNPAKYDYFNDLQGRFNWKHMHQAFSDVIDAHLNECGIMAAKPRYAGGDSDVNSDGIWKPMDASALNAASP